MDTDTKTCPHCAETIKVTAKVCPHCRCWQKKWSLQNPQVAATLWVSLWMVAFLVLFAIVEKMFGQKERFAEYRDEIKVVGSQFSHRISSSSCDTNPSVYVTVVGTLTNRSDIGWKDVMVEVQFLDKAGQLIDVIKANADYGGVVVLPHGEAAFKVEAKAAKPVPDYATHKAVVRWAKDADAWF